MTAERGTWQDRVDQTHLAMQAEFLNRLRATFRSEPFSAKQLRKLTLTSAFGGMSKEDRIMELVAEQKARTFIMDQVRHYQLID